MSEGPPTLPTVTVTSTKIEDDSDWKAAKPISQEEWESRFGFQAISEGEEKFLAFISTAEENQIRSIEKTRDGLLSNINYYQDLGKIVQDITDIETAAKEKIAVVTQSGLDREKAANEAKAAKKAADHEEVLQFISTERENEIRSLLATQEELVNKTNILSEQNAIRERTKELIAEVNEEELTGLQKWAEEAKSFEQIATDVAISASNSFASGFTDAFFEFAEGTKTAEEAFKQFAASFLKQIAKMIIQALILKAIKAGMGAFGDGGVVENGEQKPLAKGGVFSQGKMMEYAKGAAFNNGRMKAFATGGIVNSPTVFPMKDGMGLMGEAGPEAIMPLKRGKDGKLGVAGSGGNTINTTINITNGGGEESDDKTKRSRELANVIKIEFNKNLMEQMRPGGALNMA